MKYIIVATVLFIAGCAKYHDGADAKPCTTYSINVGAIIQCPDGTQSFVPKGTLGPKGIKGDAGSPGTDGVDGTQGARGSAGSVITSIALCPGIDSSEFRETALRIDGAIYAVYYYPPEAFLTEIHPGNYTTTDGRACNFTVNSDLTITQ